MMMRQSELGHNMSRKQSGQIYLDFYFDLSRAE